MDRRKEKFIRAALACFLTLLLPIFSLCYVLLPVYYPASADVEEIRQRFLAEKHIIHAGGFIETRDGGKADYTNSYDALINMYEKGNRICEIDIKKLRDGTLVCAHGTDDGLLANGTDLYGNATGEEFLSSKIYSEFSPMSVENLAGFMRQHPDLLIVTDVKSSNIDVCKLLAEKYPDLRRQFVIQIYHADEYEAIQRLGFPYIIFTMYMTEPEERNIWKLAKFGEEHELIGFTFPKHYFSLKLRIAMASAGTPFFFHTINDYAEMERYLNKRYVFGIYTDQVTFPNDLTRGSK